MKAIFPVTIAILLSIFAACKKEDPQLPTGMRVKVDDDTVFVTTKVTSTLSGAILYIKGISDDGTKSVELALDNYVAKPGTYTIDLRGIGGSTGKYTNGSTLVQASGGKVIVNSISDGVIKGTFNIYYYQTDIMGSFTAPQK